MKSEGRLFFVLAVFLFAMAALYAWWTDVASPEQAGHRGIEWIGVVALILSGLLLTMVGSALWMISRRIEPRPEDRADAEIAEGAGDLGFFSPGSYWPFGLALSAMIASLGLGFNQWWLVAVGLLAVLVATCGLMFEYYTGSRRGAEH
ncbi:cytochrome c oxidase subunit 4 [Dactylosporangium roseum]|uniref:Cytochrome c oxidase polypeptide 4 n=1 Tax=Dactylosporangium roseum TaxID=47989 RepID=A0ABY5YZZ8_9ACTN|nr:cytochrome c oxidase subunit 4 [Dactylosporangium roseum]UWZ35330.1 cytochrome c oxidase subunit 4 [Dactylosporangium roseum]